MTALSIELHLPRQKPILAPTAPDSAVARTMTDDRPRPTLAEVARRAGVSEITASRALRGGGNVARQTRARVQSAALALNYMPNRLAGTLAGGASRQVAVILPSLSNSVFADLLKGLETRLEAAGYHPILGISDYDPHREYRLVTELLAWRPAGIVLAPTASTPQTRATLATCALPVVEVMDIDPPPIDMAVGVSHLAAGRAMAHFLLGRGYRRLAYVGHDISSDPRALSRLRGLEQGLAEADQTLEARLTFPGPSSVPLGRDAVARLLQTCPPGRLALCFSNDDMAVGGMFHALAAGLHVPDDLALAGFNGLAIGQALPLPLTTIASRRAEIGDTAAQALLARLDNQPVAAVQDLGFRLIPGATT